MGIENIIVDSASIEVSRRGKRAKTDRLDAGKLAGMLLRYHAGDRKVWSVVRVPTPEEEDRRHLHRELKAAKRDRTRITNRIRALLFGQGIHLPDIRELPQRLGSLCIRNGEPLPKWLAARIGRAWKQVEMITQVIRELVVERRKLLRSAKDPGTECARKLLRLGAIGPETAWLFALEFYSWRQFRNRREVGALAGLTPTPYQSGDDSREQGICKAGNRWIRSIAIEIAWAPPALPAAERAQPMVRAAIRTWRHTAAQDRHRRAGEEAPRRALEVPGDRHAAGGRHPEGGHAQGFVSR